MTEAFQKTRRSIGNIPELSSVTFRADKRRSVNFDNSELSQPEHISFNTDRCRSVNADNATLPLLRNSSLGRPLTTTTQSRRSSRGHTVSTSPQGRRSSLARTLLNSTNRVLSPLRRIRIMSFHSKDGSSGASSNLSSPGTPLATELNVDNYENNSTVPTPRARQPSNVNLQNERISAHFDDTSKSYDPFHSRLLSTALQVVRYASEMFASPTPLTTQCLTSMNIR